MLSVLFAQIDLSKTSFSYEIYKNKILQRYFFFVNHFLDNDLFIFCLSYLGGRLLNETFLLLKVLCFSIFLANSVFISPAQEIVDVIFASLGVLTAFKLTTEFIENFLNTCVL